MPYFDHFREGDTLQLSASPPDQKAVPDPVDLALQITGDCLFSGGVGRTWKDFDFDRLLDDVSRRVFDVYPDSTVVYPLHGDDTTLGAERPHLGEWKERGR